MTQPTAAPSPLASDRGRTTIADGVVATVAGLAARRVPGVHALGGSGALGGLSGRIPGARSAVSRGVAVEVGERQAAVDLTLVVEYGARVVDLARAVRRDVIAAVEGTTGLEVVEVGIAVVDLHLPAPPAPAPEPERVR